MVTIEKATKADLNEILELQKLAFLSEAQLLNNFLISPLTENIEPLQEKFKIGIVIKAIEDTTNKIIGSVRGYEKDKTLFIEKLIVHPDYQNKGVGKSLLNYIENCFPSHRYELFTSSKSPKNLSFYKNAGYKTFKTTTTDNNITFDYLEKEPISKNEFDSEYCNVKYNDKENAVVLEWKKFASFENYRKPTTFALELLRANKGSNFIINAKNGFEDEKADVEWGLSFLLPEMSKEGCKVVIFVMNEVNDIEEEMDMWSVEFSKYFILKKTDSLEKAFEILKAEKRIINKLELFLLEDKYINYSSQNIKDKAKDLFSGVNSDLEKAKIAFEFVRDKIPHTFDINGGKITAKATDVLKYGTGICHAKANLLAALLRCEGIPCGICFEHLTLADDDSMGYCVHAYNAVYVDNRWIKIDARGNKPGVDAQFSLNEPKLAYPPRPQYDEYYWDGIYSHPQADTMKMLEEANNIQDIMDNIPDYLNEKPDID